MCLWHSGIVSVSHTGDSEFEPSNLFKIIIFLSLNSANSVKTFRKNSLQTANFSVYQNISGQIARITNRLESIKQTYNFINSVEKKNEIYTVSTIFST